MSPPRRLRIFMTADAVGGVWIFASTLARELARHNCEVMLVTLGPIPSAAQVHALGNVPGLTIETTDLALEWLDPEGLDFARARQTLTRLAHRFRPDVIHLNSYREAAIDFGAPVVVTAHSCVQSWWLSCRGELPGEPRWRRYARNVQAGMKAADAWVSPTSAFQRTIEKLYAPSPDGRTIWNGIDERLEPAAGKEPFILAAGRLWDEAKNVSLLARVAPQSHWPIKAAGPAQPDNGVQFAGGALDWLGDLSHADLLAVMQRAAVFAAPAVYEPFGLTVLEAAASGCALALADIPTLRELWDGAALFVDPRDDDAWTAVLNDLVRNASLRHELQRSAARRARRFSLHITVARYLDLYKRIAHVASRRPQQSAPAQIEAVP